MTSAPSKPALAAWIELHRSQRRLLEQVEKSLHNNNLPPLAWYDVLLELDREKVAGLRQFELVEKTLLNKHNLSRLIDRLVKSQLVERQACEEDGRGNRIKITEAGEASLKQIWPVYRKAIADNFASRLDDQEHTELARLLTRLQDPA